MDGDKNEFTLDGVTYTHHLRSGNTYRRRGREMATRISAIEYTKMFSTFKAKALAQTYANLKDLDEAKTQTAEWIAALVKRVEALEKRLAEFEAAPIAPVAPSAPPADDFIPD